MGNILLYVAVLGFGVFVVAVVLMPFVMVYQWWRMRSALAESTPERAFIWRVTPEKLRTDKKLVEEIRPLVISVCLMRNTYAPGTTTYGGPQVVSKFECFLIDANGSTHRVAEHREHDKAHREALEVARILEVPYRDTSYGG